jgi:hypothetical protein
VLTKSPPGPTGVGTRWHEVVRVLPFLRMTVHSVVTAIDADRRLVLDFASSWMRGTLEYTFEPTADGGAVLRQRETLMPRGPLRLADRAIARMLRPNLVHGSRASATCSRRTPGDSRVGTDGTGPPGTAGPRWPGRLERSMQQLRTAAAILAAGIVLVVIVAVSSAGGRPAAPVATSSPLALPSPAHRGAVSLEEALADGDRAISAEDPTPAEIGQLPGGAGWTSRTGGGPRRRRRDVSARAQAAHRRRVHPPAAEHARG